MPRVKPHHHPCQSCGVKTECGGCWEENYDGSPEVICPEFHLNNGEVNSDFICDACDYERTDRSDSSDDELWGV